jgi:hypothetical protein
MEDKTIDDTDGVKILMEGSWVLVRPSGTEPIYRIFAEAESQEKAKSLAEDNKRPSWILLPLCPGSGIDFIWFRTQGLKNIKGGVHDESKNHMEAQSK